MSIEMPIDEMIAKLEGLGDNFVLEASWNCAEAWREELQKQINSGVDPDGKPWPLRKDTGTRPLQNADQQLRVAPVGKMLIARLTGPAARHHRGIARGGLARHILPVKGIPKGTADAIRVQLVKRFNEII